MILMNLERIYTVPLAVAYEAPRHKRVPNAVKVLRAFISRHMKSDGLKVSISASLNDFLWARSIQKPPRKIKIRAVKNDSGVMVTLAEETPLKSTKAKESKKEVKPSASEAAPKEVPKSAPSATSEKPKPAHVAQPKVEKSEKK